MPHVILLTQRTASPNSRHWEQYESLSQAYDAVIAMYEERLKALNPTTPNITYDLAALHLYIDSLADVALLVATDQTGTNYRPHDRTWLKQKLLLHLRRQVPRA